MNEHTTNTTSATTWLCTLTLSAALLGCSSPPRTGAADAGPDASNHAHSDASSDANSDATTPDTADTSTGGDARGADVGDADGPPTRAFPSARDLQDGVVPDRPVETASLGALDRAEAEGVRSGTLTLRPGVARADTLQDDLGYLAELGATEPPTVTFGWEARGAVVLPARPGLRETNHPRWDVILGEGERWIEPADGGAERFLMPIHLVDRGQNCTLHGVFTFVLGDAQVTDAYYQFGQETCPYFKTDLWGTMRAEWEPGEVDAGAAFDAHASRAQAAPTRAPLERLGAQGVDVENLRRGPTPEHVTARGVVWRGVHYADPPETRHGPYPLPGALFMPSYSTAKSAFAALGALALSRDTPDLLERTLGEGLGLEPAHPYAQVTLTQLLDMSTGRYDSDAYMADEGGERMATFFVSYDAEARRDVALGYPVAAAPGERFVYHTSDTYLAAAMLDAHTRAEHGLGLYAWMREEVFPRVGVWVEEDTTLRDARSPEGVPLGGYGVWWRPDELASLAATFSDDAPTWVDRPAYRRALRRVGASPSPVLGAGVGLEYALGFWSTTFGPDDGFPCEVTVPFMSGYGGITVALLPNGAAYYYVSDQFEFSWIDPARELAGLGQICP